ncbi:MAG: lytic transglycosylase domain-containing protein, partial [Acetobacteraceae bacterium]
RWFGLIPQAEPTHQQFVTAFGQKTTSGSATGFMNRIGQNAEIRGQKFEGAYAPTNLHALAQKYSAKYNLPPGVLDRLLMVESGYGKHLVSPAGALGPAQLMPGTAAALNVDPLNAAQNVRGGAEYLADQISYYGSLPKAVAAYDAGPGAVDAAVKKYGAHWLAHMPPETQKEVARIAGAGASATDKRVAAVLARRGAAPAPATFPHSFGTPPVLAHGTLPAPAPARTATAGAPAGMAAVAQLSDIASVRSRYWQTHHGARIRVENDTSSRVFISTNAAPVP